MRRYALIHGTSKKSVSLGQAPGTDLAGLTDTPTKIVYIVGAGRSGSTVLDIVLGNHPDIESVGELGSLTCGGWVNDAYCACGERVNACPFWSEVRREWVERIGEDHVDGYLALQNAFERYRRLPLLLRERWWRQTPRFQAYARYTRALFEAIRAVSGKPVVVDSSKKPTRALALAMTPGIDFRLLHIVRDVRGVAASRVKTFQKDERAGLSRDHEAHPAWHTAVHWVRVNLASWWIRRGLGSLKTTRVFYEEFLANPEGVLDEIGRVTQLELTDLGDAVSAGGDMNVGHNVGGNRLRMAGTVKLRSEAEEWKNILSIKDRLSLSVVAGWLMRLYRYK